MESPQKVEPIGRKLGHRGVALIMILEPPDSLLFFSFQVVLG